MDLPLTTTDILAPSIGTLFIWASYANCMTGLVNIRKATKSVTLPYRPWLHTDEKVYRAHRAVENIREWTVMTVPMIWVFSLFAKHLPVVGEYVPITTVGVSVMYAVLARLYFNGYASSMEERVRPFWIRMRLVQALLGANIISLGYAAYTTYL